MTPKSGRLISILRLIPNRIVLIMPCLFLMMILAQNALTKEPDIKALKNNATTHERRLGPFKINEKEFKIILKILKYKGAIKGFDETVSAFSIVDEKGVVHYQKSFDVEIGKDKILESIDISAYALESNGRKGFINESGKLKALPDSGYRPTGLILYFGFTPSAPSTGLSCQVFSLNKSRLVPLFSPLTVYGRIYELPKGSSPNSLRLLKGNTIKFGIWTGWFEVVVPVKVLDGLGAAPLIYDLTSGLNVFDVVVERRPSDEDTFVRFFDYPETSSLPRHVIIRKNTKIEFLQAYTKVLIESGAEGSTLSVEEMPWLKVKIDGQKGFVKDAEDLQALGIYESG